MQFENNKISLNLEIINTESDACSNEIIVYML